MNKEENDKKQYTVVDIDRYLRGKMSAAEMYAIEKAALEDPFLADAIEGYNERSTLQHQDVNEDLDELKYRLKDRIEPVKEELIVGIRWWRVAAVILLLAGTGSIVYKVVNTSGLQGKSVLTKNDAYKQDTVRTSVTENKSVAVDTASIALNESAESTSPKAGLMESKREKLLKSKALNPFRYRLKSANPVAVPLEDSAPQSLKYELDKDKAGMASVSKTIKEEPIASKKIPETASQNEVASDRRVIGRGYLSIRYDAEPEIGYAEYNKYVEKNKKYDSLATQLHGDVVISFFVSASGKLSNFNIEKSLSKPLDEEAIRLIKNGPAWKVLKNKQTKVEFPITF